MDEKLALLLERLPTLSRQNAQASSKTCKVCGRQSLYFGTQDFLRCAGGHPFGKSDIAVNWYFCDSCDYLFTDFFDDWTTEEFSSHVYNADYIKVDPEYLERRPRRVAQWLPKFLSDNQAGRVLDYGGGAGLLASLMREHGVDAACYDPFSSPMRPEGKFDVVTCFEVIEHTPTPIQTLQDIASFLKPDGYMILGISLQPADIRKLGVGWWYCAPRNGHCSTYSVFTLATLAAECGMTFHVGTSANIYALSFTGQAPAPALRIGKPAYPVRLGAPKENSAAWHGLERNFRWSAAESITWKVSVPVAPALLWAKLLYHAEPKPGFAKLCTLKIADHKIEVGPDALAQIEVSTPGVFVAELRNPTLHCPADTGSNDKRKLGIALRVE